MAAPYFLMALLYLALAALAVFEMSLVSFQLLPPLPGLRWFTVHLVVLGALTQLIFGVLPILYAARMRLPRPRLRWDTWLLLNAGLILLLPGVAVMNFLLITLGATLIFLAVLQLGRQLFARRPQPLPTDSTLGAASPNRFWSTGSLKFYLAGLGYLLVGILVGAGLWQDWAGPLRIAIPKEVHVHSNLWGFTALVFAGLLIDLSPSFTGQKWAWPKAVGPIFWLMTLGALGLVLGPWLDIDLLQVAGLTAHTLGSILLMLAVFWPIRKHRRRWDPALWRILFSYVWFFLPVVVAPLVVVQMGVGNEVAGSGGPLLIFGWILQFLSAILPALLHEAVGSGERPRLRSPWKSLVAINLGSFLYWLSLFLAAGRGPLRGTAFLLWLVALLPLLPEILTQFRLLEKRLTA